MNSIAHSYNAIKRCVICGKKFDNPAAKLGYGTTRCHECRLGKQEYFK